MRSDITDGSLIRGLCSSDRSPCIFEFTLSYHRLPSPSSSPSRYSSAPSGRPSRRSSQGSAPYPIGGEVPHLHADNAIGSSEAASSETAPSNLVSQVSNTIIDMAFRGSYRGSLWNAQGLFARKAAKHEAKWAKVMNLLRHRDFLIVTETHSTVGKALAEEDRLRRAGFQAFWSHGGHRRAGVGIIIRSTFLDRFQSYEPRWLEGVIGEAATLQLHGLEGNLDIHAVYFPTGNQGAGAQQGDSLFQRRCHIRSFLERQVRPNHSAHTLIGGDFNYVVVKEDRWSNIGADWSKVDDEREEDDWNNKLGEQRHIHELYQPHATHSSSHARSRLDRIYSNHSAAEQLDTTLGCAALDWDPTLSHHRPVVFFRKAGAVKPPRTGPLPDGPLRKMSWSRRVYLEFQDRMAAQGHPHCALRQLALLKTTIADITWNMQDEDRLAQAAGLVQETDDCMGWTLRFIRAAERQQRSTMQRCIRAYPYLAQLVDWQDPQLREGGRLEPLRSHAVELARASIVEELRAIQNDEGTVDDSVQRTRRSRVEVRLQKLRPGACTGIAAVQCQDGSMASDPASIARELRRYWGDIFQARPHDANLLEDWIKEELKGRHSVFGDEVDWLLSVQDIIKAINKAPNTMPGPDGIPYRAWKRLGPFGADMLHRAALALSQEDAQHALRRAESGQALNSHSFNVGNMVFLPKKPAGVSPELGEYFTAADVRPLVIVNTDNRLIANALRLKLEPTLPRWISQDQRGFIGGRSMLANIVDIEHASQHGALKHAQGGTVLFDFRAAFPSLNHQYMLKVLKALGVPRHIHNMIKMMYDDHKCNIIVGGEVHDGFHINAGIRQGCPLSPLIFAFVVDLVLRRIKTIIPEAIVRAFADDIAVVLSDVPRDIPLLIKMFAEVARISGLNLNLPKCVCIPLWRGSLLHIQQDFAQRFPDWAAMKVDWKGTYLGYVIGPEARDLSWSKPLRKYKDRAAIWGKIGLGQQYAAAAYGIHVISTLSFVGQLCAPPLEAFEAEAKALRDMVPGPFLWCTPEDLFYFAELYGQKRSFPSLQFMCLAAQRRVHKYENKQNGGLRVQQRFNELQRWKTESNHCDRIALWHSWFEWGPIATLHHTKQRLDEYGLQEKTLIEKAVSKESTDSEDPEREIAIRRNFQKVTRASLTELHKPNHVERMRHKINRWSLPGNIGHTCPRIMRALQRIKELVTPRVAAAVLRTLWNGWTTARRFQKQGPCLFGCAGRWKEDSIEHYAHCSIVLDFARRALQIDAACGTQRLGHFVTLGLNADKVQEDDLVRRALLLYAVYRATNLLRHIPMQSLDSVNDMLLQFAKEGVRGHGSSTAILDGFAAHPSRFSASAHEDGLDSLFVDGLL